MVRTTGVEKKLGLELSRLQAQYPQADLELWSGAGETPPPVKMNIAWDYNQYCDVFGHLEENSQLQKSTSNINGSGFMVSFIQSQEKTKAWILPYVNTELFNRVLADFAREFQLNTNKRVLLVLDQAGWHISHQLKLPEGLDLFFLPAHSPELQPCRHDFGH